MVRPEEGDSEGEEKKKLSVEVRPVKTHITTLSPTCFDVQHVPLLTAAEASCFTVTLCSLTVGAGWPSESGDDVTVEPDDVR